MTKIRIPSVHKVLQELSFPSVGLVCLNTRDEMKGMELWKRKFGKREQAFYNSYRDFQFSIQWMSDKDLLPDYHRFAYKHVARCLNAKVCIVTGGTLSQLFFTASKLRARDFNAPMYLAVDENDIREPRNLETAAKSAKRYGVESLAKNLIYLLSQPKSPLSISLDLDLDPDLDPDPDPDPDPEFKFVEGSRKIVKLSRVERNRQARKECLKHFGFDCAVCGFNFQSQFVGLEGSLIHVHHLSAMSESNGEREVDPKTDLRPVCPNCHTVIHSRKPMYSIEEAKRILRSRSHNE